MDARLRHGCAVPECSRAGEVERGEGRVEGAGGAEGEDGRGGVAAPGLARGKREAEAAPRGRGRGQRG
eukprot:223630-Prymnesium_polylepis.1